jgi:hypothetical protein
MEPYGAAESSIGLHRAAHEKLKIFLGRFAPKLKIFSWGASRRNSKNLLGRFAPKLKIFSCARLVG